MSNRFVQRGGVWLLGQAALLLGVILSGLIWRDTWQSSVSVILGRLLLFASALGTLAGLVALGRNLTPFPKPAADVRLVRTGVYGWMRHPLYAAVFCGGIGWALFWQSGPALGLALALGVFFDRKARQEERWLRQQFPEYAAYAQRVRRFIPGLY